MSIKHEVVEPILALMVTLVFIYLIMLVLIGVSSLLCGQSPFRGVDF